MKKLYLFGFLSLFFISALFMNDGEADCACKKKSIESRTVKTVSYSLKTDLNKCSTESPDCGGNCGK